MENQAEFPAPNKVEKKLDRRHMLTLQEYKDRRSDTLLHNPEAQLDELGEIRKYFERQGPAYAEKINALAQLDKPMNPNCRMVIAIPAYNEGSRVKHTLEQYGRQQNIDPKAFEILIFSTPAEGDTTEEEVSKFKEEHPEFSVTLVTDPQEENQPKGSGIARKYISDIAMSRILQRGFVGKDTILVSNDADAIEIEESYLSSILSEFDENPTIDALQTRIKIPDAAMTKPNVAAYELKNTFEEIFSTGNIGEGKELIPEPSITNGCSTALRTSIYAAVGGYNPESTIANDWELGWLIADARDWDPKRIIYFDKTYMVTDPRRYFDCVLHRVPLDQDLLDSEIRPELRGQNNDEIFKLVPDELDWELLQDDADSVWRSQYTGSNNRIGERRFKLIFDAMMERLGIEYVIDPESETTLVKLTNVDGFKKRLAAMSGKDDIAVVHSEPRVYTPDMIQNIGNFFTTSTSGYIEARKAKATKIADEIKSAQMNGEQERLSELMIEYERFAGDSYDSMVKTL